MVQEDDQQEFSDRKIQTIKKTNSKESQFKKDCENESARISLLDC